jgi:uracil-DNA glycosylase
MSVTLSRPELEDILRFYHEAGLDFATGEEPIDRFAAFDAQKTAVKPAISVMPALEKKSAAPIPRPAAIPDEAAVAAGKALAEGCASIPELLAALQGFDGCGLKFTAKSLVFADGNPDAQVMFISDVPSREDDLEGRLLAGPNGLLFDRMLAAIGLDRTTAYLGCMIPWRPPGNRAPTAFEIDVCRPFIQRHIELAAPKLLVLMGDLPAKTLILSSDSILRLRGQWREYALAGGGAIPALSMLHPAYLMKQSAQKRLAWADLLALKARLN